MRIWICLATIVILGVAVLQQMCLPSFERASWYEYVLTAVALLMCWGGVESAYWMLRKSPIASITKGGSDWGTLWLWSGIPSGLIMISLLILGWLADSIVPQSISIILITQAIMGPALWVLAILWLSKEAPSFRKSQLYSILWIGGLLSHLLGILISLYLFPGFANLSMHYFFNLASNMANLYSLAFFHLLLIGCFWSLAFKMGLKNRLK